MWRRNRSQVEDDKRIADSEPRTYLPDASVHPTDARKTTEARSAPGACRSLMQSTEGFRERAPKCRHPPCDRRTGRTRSRRTAPWPPKRLMRADGGDLRLRSEASIRFSDPDECVCIRVIRDGRRSARPHAFGGGRIPKSARELPVGMVLALALGGVLLGTAPGRPKRTTRALTPANSRSDN